MLDYRSLVAQLLTIVIGKPPRAAAEPATFAHHCKHRASLWQIVNSVDQVQEKLNEAVMIMNKSLQVQDLVVYEAVSDE